MGKLLHQVILLTRKNLKVRFSHRCLIFSELVIPLLLSLLLGLLVSYFNKDGTGKRDHLPANAGIGRDNTVDSKFHCKDYDNDENSYHSFHVYNCARMYKAVDQLNSTIKVYSQQKKEEEVLKKVVFVMTDNVAQSVAGQELVKAVMKNVIEQGQNTTLAYYVDPEILSLERPLEWEQSDKSERELEICVVQRHSSCRDIFAVVVVTNVEDGVAEKKKIQVDYKIRMTHSYGLRFSKEYMHRLLLDYKSPMTYYTSGMMEKFYLPSHASWSETPIGFTGLQALIDQGIAQFVNDRQNGSKSFAGSNQQVQMSLVRMPYIIYKENYDASDLNFLSLIFCLLVSLAIFSLMRVNTEKSSGFKELLRMHGVTVSTQWMAWFLSNFLVYSVWTLVLALLLWLPWLGGANVLTLMNFNGILYWLLLLLFMNALVTFCFLISVFFERVWTAASVGLLCWILLIVVMMLVSMIFHELSTGVMVVLMLIPTVAFDFAVRLVLNGGGTLATFGAPVIENLSLTVLHCLVMLLVDSCIFLALTVYLDNVMPSKYGISQSPWYVVRNLKSYLRRFTRKNDHILYETAMLEDDLRQSNISLERISPVSPGTENQQPFQPDPENIEAAVVLKNLKKRYRNSKVRAVDGLSAKVFTGEIYSLLGFNGSGKTTTIAILTGLFAPTGGHATIFDLDIEKDMEEIRRYTGLCPQHNLLYDDMSVLDQVAFFGRLKGLVNPYDKAKGLLTWLGMEEKLTSKPEQLSGGQKRRVHLAIALIGDTKVAFLDEPTSGLDPESRRGVWDILLKLRGKVTVILTTHDMEEADVLGDRIGIMSEGKMICSGTPSFLKKYYGVGYNLKMNAVSSHCDDDKIHKFVRHYVPSATLNTGCDLTSGYEDGVLQRRSNWTISITLPTTKLDISRMADMMDAIQQQRSVLGVDNIGLSLSTMDEVFLKVGESVRAVDVAPPDFDISKNSTSSVRYEGRQLQWYRFLTLVLKRAAHFCHAPFTMALLILVFALFLYLSLIALYSELPLKDDETIPPRLVSSSSLRTYNSPVIFLHDNHAQLDSFNNTDSISYSLQKKLGNYGDTQVKLFPKEEKSTDILQFLKLTSLQDLPQYSQHYFGGASFNATDSWTNFTGFFSAYALHGAPVAFNLISHARIKKIYDVDATIEVINHPLPQATYLKFLSPEYLVGEVFYYYASGPVILLVIIASLLTSTATFLPTEERLNKGKQLQLMTGTTPFIYWMSMFTWDFFFFSLVNIIITSVYYFAENNSDHKIFTGHGAGAVIYLILECYTFAALWFSYLVSWLTCIKTPSDGFLIVNKFAVVVGILGNVIRHFVIQQVGYEFYRDNYPSILNVVYKIADLLGYVMWPVPMHSLYLSMMKLAAVGYQNNACNLFPTDVLRLACESVEGFERSQNDTWFMHSCCENCKENCFEPSAYLSTAPVKVILTTNRWYDTHGILFDLLAMLLSGVVSAGILYFLEYEWPKIKAKRQQRGSSARNTNSDVLLTQEENVVAEAVRISDMVNDKGSVVASNFGFVGHNLVLKFDSVKVVKGLSFGVSPGECFGLLGISGSGKTSTFRIITGDVIPNTGSMFSCGFNYHGDRASYLASMGYCPQFDAIIGRLTGLQMVKLYGALRGIPLEKLSEEARIWLDKFGLLGSANKKCAAYSGGMKRRLSVAMALIGNPKLILLDEPTTGVDPAFRRQFWNVIRELQGKGQSILLTSYTMEECEQLCTRLGIMVDGQFKCLGNTRHLKRKFGKGFILTIRLKKFVEEDDTTFTDLVDRLKELIAQRFTPCRLQSQQKTLIQYQIQNKSMWYSDIFRNMEQIRSVLNVEQIMEEYSVTETSLEDVFISFASKH